MCCCVHNYCLQYNRINKKSTTKPEGAIRNGQSRETGNMGNTRHRTKINKIYNKIKHNIKNLKD